MAEVIEAPEPKSVGGFEFELTCVLGGLNNLFGTRFAEWNLKRGYSYTKKPHNRNSKSESDVTIHPIGWRDNESIRLLVKSLNYGDEWCTLWGLVYSVRFFPESTHDFSLKVNMDYMIEPATTESKNLLKSLGLL